MTGPALVASAAPARASAAAHASATATAPAPIAPENSAPQLDAATARAPQDSPDLIVQTAPGQAAIAVPPMPLEPALVIDYRGPFHAWYDRETKALPQSFPGESFEVPSLRLRGPVYFDRKFKVEGLLRNGDVVSAFTDREASNGDPIQVIVGVPGAGKSYSAIELMAKGEGEVAVFTATSGSRLQLEKLADARGRSDMFKHVQNGRDLLGKKRILIDEAGRVLPHVIQYLLDAEEVVVCGDNGQSQANPGGSLLGVLAALGAPMRVLTQSRRTTNPALKLLNQFVTDTIVDELPSAQRMILEPAVEVRHVAPGTQHGDVAELQAMHSDMLVVSFDKDEVAVLGGKGHRALHATQIDGVEADHVCVILPRAWLDSGLVPKLPWVSLINSFCRARQSGTLIIDFGNFDMIVCANRSGNRAYEINSLIDVITHDPRKIADETFDFWPRQQVGIARNISFALDKNGYAFDRIGRYLLVYKKQNEREYEGVFVFSGPDADFEGQIFLDKGFRFAASVDPNSYALYGYSENASEQCRQFVLRHIGRHLKD